MLLGTQIKHNKYADVLTFRTKFLVDQCLRHPKLLIRILLGQVNVLEHAFFCLLQLLFNLLYRYIELFLKAAVQITA